MHTQNPRNTTRAVKRTAQRGLSLIELMVGAALGLIVVAAGTTLLVNNLREQRGLLNEVRLMQDLRAAVDLISRDLRRDGYWAGATQSVWTAGAAGVVGNPYAAVAPAGAASNAVSLRYSRDSNENNQVDSNEQFGYRLRAGVIEVQLGAGNWQALTEALTMKVTEFSVAPAVQDIPLQALCATECRTGSSSCPPRQQVRSIAIVVTGTLLGDPRVRRSVRSEVRVRNDPITGSCEI